MTYNKNISNTDEDINMVHVDVLDGIRAIAVLIVVWFHIWQQSWLMPVIETPSLSFINVPKIDLDWLPRSGYIMVTMMIFLSGFCLYLPYARHSITKAPLPETSLFYRKRVARILPSYLFCIIVVLIFNICTGAYAAPEFGMSDSKGFIIKDVLTHLTFTFNLFPDVSIYTLLNGVLWTVALEVQFYILFPLIQSFFRKKPVHTYAIMNLISFVFIVYAQNHNTSFLLHQLPAYLSVYANGFVGAHIFVSIASKFKRDKNVGLLATITSIGCIFVYSMMMKNLINSENINGWELHNRFYLSVLFMVFVLSTALSLSFYRKIFANSTMRFLSTISFNLYIWHQIIATTLKDYRIPYFSGDTPPNESYDKVWMWTYTVICLIAAFAASVLTTYLIEKPCSKFIMNLKWKSHSRKSAGK